MPQHRCRHVCGSRRRTLRKTLVPAQRAVCRFLRRTSSVLVPPNTMLTLKTRRACPSHLPGKLVRSRQVKKGAMRLAALCLVSAPLLVSALPGALQPVGEPVARVTFCNSQERPYRHLTRHYPTLNGTTKHVCERAARLWRTCPCARAPQAAPTPAALGHYEAPPLLTMRFWPAWVQARRRGVALVWHELGRLLLRLRPLLFGDLARGRSLVWVKLA